MSKNLIISSRLVKYILNRLICEGKNPVKINLLLIEFSVGIDLFINAICIPNLNLYIDPSITNEQHLLIQNKLHDNQVL